jgi:CheY-like chemotaxis protein
MKMESVRERRVAGKPDGLPEASTKDTAAVASVRYRVLVADDEDSVLKCYLRAFSAHETRQGGTELDELDARLFSTSVVGPATDVGFDVTTCSQGNDALALFRQATAGGAAFDAAILDVRMPPGISGIEAGRRIRELDSNVPLIFVTGFSDVAEEELIQLIPPREKLVYLRKPLSFRKLVLDLARRLT